MGLANRIHLVIKKALHIWSLCVLAYDSGENCVLEGGPLNDKLGGPSHNIRLTQQKQ